jgi:2-oxoglutarate/2-oxoacid ferredoxin oxidoreductase subunit alpha
MPENKKEERVLIDGSRLIIESLARSGADAFIGYPITPANLLYYYASKRMELMLAAPDEITTLQWMSGLAATGKLPVTATSFPGFALMLESINMAYMMELPMVIVLVQRLGPATGTATCGAQGDLLLLKGMISGGHPLPVLAPASYEDCWELSAKATEMALKMRTPVVLLTSKEEVMTQRSFDISKLADITPAERLMYKSECTYKSYKPNELVPDFLPVGHETHQVRLNASTHDQSGILQHSSPEAMQNTRRLEEKIYTHMTHYAFYDYDRQEGAEKIVVAYGISASAARDAVNKMRAEGGKTSLLIPKTMLPLPEPIRQIIASYTLVLIAEESMNNQLGEILYGQNMPSHIRFCGGLGKMITPEQIIQEVQA